MSFFPLDLGQLSGTLQERADVRVVGLKGSAPAFLVAGLAPKLNGPVLWLLPDEETARHARAELTSFLGSVDDRRILLYPAADTDPYSGMSPHADLSRQRVEILARLLDGKPDIIVASVGALSKRVVPTTVLGNNQELLAIGEEIDRDALLHSLMEWGYLATDHTEDPGCFSVRGHVLDLYPPGFSGPLRVELWGDEIDSIRLVDAATQRSMLSVDEAVILPVREEVLDAAAVERFGRSLKAFGDEREVPPRLRIRLKEQLEHGRYFAGIEDYLPVFYPELDTFFDYLGPDATLVMGGMASLDAALEQEPARVRRAYRRGDAWAALVPEPDELYLTEDEFRRELADRTTLELPELTVEGDEGPGATAPVRMETGDHSTLRAEILAAREREGGMLTPLLRRLDDWHEQGCKVLLACPSRIQGERVGELLAERDVRCVASDRPFTARELLDPRTPLRLDTRAVTTVTAPLARGFSFPAANLVVLTRAEIFGVRRRRRTTRRERLGAALSSFSQLSEKDIVVHAKHGVGRYMGMHKIETPKSRTEKKQDFLKRARDPRYQVGDQDVGHARGQSNDFLLLEYRGGDRLYVPIHKLDLLHRYAAVEGAAPPLDRLGGQSWSKRRKKVEAAVQKMAAELLALYAARQEVKGVTFSGPDSMYREFSASFPFDETEDQLEAIRAIQKDLVDVQPMDRLLCGDVGYGKTEVALRGVFQAVASGYQVAVLVPTTILALQHFLTFRERLENFPISVDMISRFRTPREKRDVMRKLASGELDIVVGTHALLGRDVSYKRLGLLVIDEEHRFGVKQKEKIKALRKGVDVLSMTATPIPRTLNMALSGLRSFSLIETPPEGRQEVRTFITRFSAQRIRDAVEAELHRGGQVFFVHNRVRSIHAMERFLHKLLPGVDIGVAHGQMSETELERVMVDFVSRKLQLLLCTTIIESGIDIPTCNTILIHRADRLGLAQLYQLRGRVGRARNRGYAFLLVPPGRNISTDAVKRLKALQDNTSLGSGFKIASRDLEIRGAGNLLGKEQSGSVNAVGLHTYLEMLEEAVRTLQGKEGGAPNPEIELRVDAYIPADYIPDQRDRLLYYKQLSDAPSEDAALSIVEELEDLYGRIPEPVQRLVELIRVKATARQLWITRIEPFAGGVRLAFHEETPLDPAKIAALVQRAGGRMTLSNDGILSFRLSKEQRRESLSVVKRLLRRLA